MPPGIWVMAADRGGTAAKLAADLASRNQTVFLADGEGRSGRSPGDGPGVVATVLDPTRRESWRALLEGLPANTPLKESCT